MLPCDALQQTAKRVRVGDNSVGYLDGTGLPGHEALYSSVWDEREGSLTVLREDDGFSFGLFEFWLLRTCRCQCVLGTLYGSAGADAHLCAQPEFLCLSPRDFSPSHFPH